uniref:esterase/lipase family protein n=1 Tax=Amycolatopsis sp. CA-126428 TaxID=2073158 RepID=UPI0011AFEC91
MTDVVAVHVPVDAVVDVVFLHGLDGDVRKSWTVAGDDGFWPNWLAQDVGEAAVWSVGYEAWSSGWRGHAMPMQDRTINVLASLQVKGIGERPLIFVTHSMGGLIVKEALLYAAYGDTEFASFAAMTKAVVFLGTPHNGSGLTKAVEALGKIYRGTAAVHDLRSNSAHLRQLSTRYQNWVYDSETGIRHLVFFETKPTRGVQVVDAGSANPGLPKVQPVGVDANHVSICKPANREALVYGRIRNFVSDIATTLARTADETTSVWDDLGRLRDFWSSRYPEKARGAGRAAIEFESHLHVALRGSIAAWLEQPGTRGPLVEALSDVFAPAPSKTAVVQAILTGRRDSLRTALENLWAVAQSAADVLADAASVLRFEIHCPRWVSATAGSVVDSWSPPHDDNSDALANFKAHLCLTATPTPRYEALELLAAGPLRVREPSGWLDRWTGKLAMAISDSRDLVDFADELLSDLARLRSSPPEDRLSHGIAVLTREFASPAEVIPGPYLAGEQPKPSHVVNGYFSNRVWQVAPAAERLELWLGSIGSTEADVGRKAPVYWFEGRSGCGKSVLMLQTMAVIRRANRGMVLWLGNNVEELPQAVAFSLANSGPGEQALIVIDDGFSPAVQARSIDHWRRTIRALSTVSDEGRQLPVIVTCGPTEQRRAFRSAFLDDVEVTAELVDEQLDSDHAAELEQWFTARTNQIPPAHLASSNVLMVQKFFQYRTGASLESFAKRFKNRLEGMEDSSKIPAFIAKLLSVNRLYVGLPAASLHALTDADRDVLAQLERDNHITVSADSGRDGVWLAHPHLADALFQGWFGEGDAHKAAGVLRDAIIECGMAGENSAERTAPLTALKLAVERAHTAAFQHRVDPELLPDAIATAYETLARSTVGISVEELPAWIRLEQVLAGVALTPTPRALGAAAIKDPSLPPETWLPTAHALLDTVRPEDEDVEELLDALRRRISSGDESSSGAGAIAARIASFTGDQVDVNGLEHWLDDPRNWTHSAWAFAYRALGSLTQSDSDAPRVWCRSRYLSPSPGRLDRLI